MIFRDTFLCFFSIIIPRVLIFRLFKIISEFLSLDVRILWGTFFLTNTIMNHNLGVNRPQDEVYGSSSAGILPAAQEGVSIVQYLDIERPKETMKNGSQEINLVNITINTIESGEELQHTQLQQPKIMTLNNPPMNKWRLVCLCFWLLLSGASDATPGALLPEMEKHYGLSYSKASLIWLGNAIGFIIIACTSHKLENWFNYKNALLMGCGGSIVMTGIVLSGTVFPVIVIAFVFGGMGIATVLARCNIFLSRFNLSKYLSVAQSFYGVGATLAPIIATSFVGAGISWNYFYLVLLGVALTSAILFQLTFRNTEQDLAQFEPDDEDEVTNNVVDTVLLKIALSNKITWLTALFVFFYQGSEVSIGGWIVTYLLDYRHGGHVVGYVASGFWGGVALGRLLLARPIHKALGARRSIIVCTLASILCVILTWVIPNVIAAGVFVSFAGFFVGPNYPIMVKFASDLLPRRIQIISITIYTAFGSAGGAFFPFLIGIISQQVGAFVVLPGFIILYSIMLLLWLMLPNKERISNGKSLSLWQRIW